MEKTINIDEINIGQRIDLFLSKIYCEYSRRFFQQLIKLGYVKVNGQNIDPDYRLKQNDILTINFPEFKSKRKYPNEFLNIIYEDDSILVINKPAGINVHPPTNYPQLNNKDITILDILLDRYGTEPEDMDTEWVQRPFIVHRLDKYTSGVMVIAKNPKSQFNLMKQFANRTITKIYLGIVYGEFIEKKGTITAPIGRDYKNRTKFRVGYGRDSITEYHLLDKFDGYSLLELRPLTGRTHQIRVHLSSINHPILGDKTYIELQKITDPKYVEINKLVNRQMLHSYKLILNHPETNNKLEFIAELPDDFLKIIDYLKNKK